jgi:diguanylate cyclase (GGDEF)-like protein
LNEVSQQPLLRDEQHADDIPPGLHSLLARQLRRHWPDRDEASGQLRAFIAAVDTAYRESDADRLMMERAFELSSDELMRANREAREASAQLEKRVEQRTTELQRANTNLQHLANHDPLTSLYNRRRFEEELERVLSPQEQDGPPGALIFLDVDQFKDVNDSLGHRAGDELLKGLADLLRSCVREGDVLARSGGDEFCILLPNTGAAQARALAQKVEDAVRHHTFLLERRPIHVTTSIGLAFYPRHGVTAEELFSNADLAMYQAKANGRGRVEVLRSNRDWRSLSEARLSWRNRILEALERDLFVLYAQPIRSLRREQAREYEVLIRLPMGRNDLANPASFLQIAEQFGLIQDIDRWVIGKTLQVIAQQERLKTPVRLAVNLSGKSFSDGEFAGFVRTQLNTIAIDPNNLLAEVTETAAIANLSQATRFIRTLRNLGIRFALDDFGAGFSSFLHLKHLPVDFLKIDGSFIKDLTQSEVDQHLVKAIVEVSRGLGKQTIAEFVGDEPTVDVLRKLGVDYVQGYYIGRPRELQRTLLDSALTAAA